MITNALCFITMLVGSHTCPDEIALPVKSISQDGVVIATSHAGNERGKTHISGSVEKAMGQGTVSTLYTHLDITAERNGKIIRSVATGFSPSTIPTSRRGTPGRSEFGVTLRGLPTDAEITVAVHRGPIHLCTNDVQQ